MWIENLLSCRVEGWRACSGHARNCIYHTGRVATRAADAHSLGKSIHPSTVPGRKDTTAPPRVEWKTEFAISSSFGICSCQVMSIRVKISGRDGQNCAPKLRLDEKHSDTEVRCREPSRLPIALTSIRANMRHKNVGSRRESLRWQRLPTKINHRGDMSECPLTVLFYR